MPLRRRDPASATALRTIREAFEDLEKTVSPADSKDFEVTTLENVQKAALEIENQLAARQSLRNMRRLVPLFSSLGYYAQTIEVLCNGTPYLPWIWAPIKIILKISSDYVEAFEQIVKAYSRIAESLTRFKVLGETFRQNTGFQQTLAVFYADILRFHTEAYKLVRRSSWRVLFLTSWGRFQRKFDNILEDLARHEQQIDKEANAHDIAEAKDMRRALEEWRQESLATVQKAEEEQTARQLEAIQSRLKDQTIQGHVRGYRIIQIYRTGFGPTNQIQLAFGSKGIPVPSFVACHFCTYSYTSSTQYDELLKSLLLQLVRASSDLAAHIYEVYVIGRKSISLSVLEQLMQTAITLLAEDLGRKQSIHMIIDGLDEMEADKQKRLVNLMNGILKLQSLDRATFKILFSSRRLQSLENGLRKKPVVMLGDEKDNLEHAICTYAEQRLKAQSQRFSQLGLSDLDFIDIGKSIAKKADGMFLWARLVLDYITQNIFYSSQELWDAIHTLPRKLAEFYERVMVQIISKFDSRSIERMRSIFGWIAFTERPLRKFELRSALSFGTGNPLNDEPVPLYVFDMGMPLIEERSDSTLTFIHVSVKDYLQMPGSTLLIDRVKEVYEHAIASVTCLLSGLEVFNVGYSNQDRIMRVLKGLHGFHVYANQYWVDYILEILSLNSEQHNLQSGLTTILRDLSNALESSGRLLQSSKKAEELAVSDSRLVLLKQYPGLYKNAQITLQARSQTMLGDVSRKEDSPCVTMFPIRGLKDAFTNYQKTVQSILSLSDFPGISKEDLEYFQQEYRTTIFTCRLPSCPRATAGFRSEILLREHEAMHTISLKCPFPGCQYPRFASARALKSHEMKSHFPTRGRKQIRKVNLMENIKSKFHANSGLPKSDVSSEKRSVMVEEGMHKNTVLPHPPDRETFLEHFSRLDNLMGPEGFDFHPVFADSNYDTYDDLDSSALVDFRLMPQAQGKNLATYLPTFSPQMQAAHASEGGPGVNSEKQESNFVPEKRKETIEERNNNITTYPLYTTEYSGILEPFDPSKMQDSDVDVLFKDAHELESDFDRLPDINAAVFNIFSKNLSPSNAGALKTLV
ncbi:uncharacterized protein BHQ10_003489 [Talaromyces amestolkiae]|uniref:C2H2-type domain-containing protein n=1 Tax=Talaromyces amestolkiae TaxID=1196081 RepID=A0A364KVA8_TALAM|nr:uncharacterized protein BHQ10_003489 [Talaromyces amestolkiae]RAO67477.1 hypothetical protein BHQ10_003489 [Talaromyces amestolkiae]